jgi:hypothetical protein
MRQDQIQLFLTRVRSEIEVIKKCRTDAGFIERISERFLIMLSNHAISSEIVKKWEVAIEHDEEEFDTLAKRGCEELTFAFKELWLVLVSSSKGSKRGILGSINYMINGVSAAKFLTSIVKITCEGGVCCFVQPPIKIAYERLENMYCDRIARSWDLCFAPNAYRFLKITSQRESAARDDSIPHSAWKQLVSLAKAWRLRSVQLRVGGGRVRGEKETMLYRAHLAA